MSLFRLDASIRTEGSHSRAIADIVERSWREGHPDAPVTRRHVGTEQRAVVRTVAALADEIINADALLFAVPLYNFGVSQHFKTWVDVMITEARLGARPEP